VRRCQRLRQLIRIANLSSPRNVQRSIRHNTVQPRTKRLLRPEASQRAKRVKKPLLNRILALVRR